MDFPIMEDNSIMVEWTYDEEPYEAVRLCLQGSPPPPVSRNDDDDDELMIDLWQLRELAWQRGGFQCPHLRKRAWPLLLDCHDPHSLESRRSNSHNLSRDLAQLQYDSTRTTWIIQEHLWASQQAVKDLDMEIQQSRRRRLHASLKKAITPANESSSVASSECADLQQEKPPPEGQETPRELLLDAIHPGTSVCSTDSSASGRASPPAVAPTELFPSAEKKLSMIRNIQDSAEDYDDNDEEVSHHEAWSEYDATSRCSSVVFLRPRNPSRQEQLVLFNAVASLLRTPPRQPTMKPKVTNSPNSSPSRHRYIRDDGRYHVFRGLVDLTALIMINVESPSLTSILMQKLAERHWRDALRPSHVAHTVLADALTHVLAVLDPQGLGGVFHVRSSSIVPSMASWFSRDLKTVEVASRLLDVLIVSHPLTIVYLAAAILLAQRNAILQHGWRRDRISLLLESSSAGRIEDILQMALGYMETIPIDKLIQETRTDFPDPDLIELLREMNPRALDSIRASTPSDLCSPWKSAVSTEEQIRRRSMARRNRQRTRRSLVCHSFPKASTALGMPQQRSPSGSFWLLTILFFCLVGTATMAGWRPFIIPSSTPSSPVAMLGTPQRLEPLAVLAIPPPARISEETLQLPITVFLSSRAFVASSKSSSLSGDAAILTTLWDRTHQILSSPFPSLPAPPVDEPPSCNHHPVVHELRSILRGAVIQHHCH